MPPARWSGGSEISDEDLRVFADWLGVIAIAKPLHLPNLVRCGAHRKGGNMQPEGNTAWTGAASNRMKIAITRSIRRARRLRKDQASEGWEGRPSDMRARPLSGRCRKISGLAWLAGGRTIRILDFFL
jgi:hypothetical protein